MRFSVVLVLLAAGCGASGKEWVTQLPDENAPMPDPGWNSGPPAERAPPALPDDGTEGGRAYVAPPSNVAELGEPSKERVTLQGTARTSASRVAAGGPSLLDELFRNTYYDFPREMAGDKDATIYDAACAPISRVTKTFHDQLCVQGSGKLASGATVSFAKRDCACAAMCPRTGQRVCFEQLDPATFPHGRGATGKPITPLRTIAVDSTVIPLGTRVFVPESVGLPKPDGSLHDGCFIAEDRGLRVVGRQIDIFTGDPAITVQWNKLLPSNHGVHVKVGDPHCK